MEDSNVTYMVMDAQSAAAADPAGGGGGFVTVEGDGQQQFAVPVMDPLTGQQTYMLLDSESAQNLTTVEGDVGEAGGAQQQFMIVNQAEGDGLQQIVPDTNTDQVARMWTLQVSDCIT